VSRRLVAGLVSVVLGVSIGFMLAHLTGVYGSDGPIGVLNIGRDDRTLIVRSMDYGWLGVRETPTTVTLTLHQRFALIIAPAGYGGQTITARLTAPIGNRRIIDSSVRGLTAPRFLRPANLPVGSVHLGDRVTFPGADAVMIEYSQTFLAPDGEVLTITQSPNLADVPVADPSGSSYSWTADGCAFTISLVAYGIGTMSRGDLVAIAASMS
jgi:hypothetical protein